MKAKDIENILNNSGKLIYKNNAYFSDWYYVGKEEVENRITKAQFEKFKLTCKNSDTTEKDSACLRGMGYRLYYWR